MQKLLAPDRSFAILNKYGIPYADFCVAKNAEAAAKAAKKIGYPVAVKVVSQKIVHKSDVGGVRVNIKSEEELLKAVNEIFAVSKKKLNVKPDGVIVQEMASGTEVIIGVKRDPQFGPVILFGLGGIFVEIMKDVSMRIAPISKEDCVEMIDSLKAVRILKGARGQKPANIESLVKILLAVSKLAMKKKDLAEMDLNPVIVNEEGAKVVDARIVEEK